MRELLLQLMKVEKKSILITADQSRVDNLVNSRKAKYSYFRQWNLRGKYAL